VAVSLLTRLGDRVAQRPDAIAVLQQDRAVSYGELWQQIGALATYLQRSGLARGDRVALLLDNSPEYIAAYYAVLAAGGTVVPLNTAARAADFAHHLRHCSARTLIADVNHAEFNALQALLSLDIAVIAVGDGAANVTVRWHDVSSARADLPTPVDDATLATIIYTSGTTGQPKGVMLSRANLASNTQSILDYLPIQSEDRVMAVLPFFYSYGNSILHTHLAMGATLVIENRFVYPHDILRKMVSLQITSFAGVPSTYALLLNRTSLEQYDLRRLRYLTQAGGAMSATMVARLQQALPQVQVFVMYGQTEASARLTYVPPARLHDKAGSVGIAIPGVKIAIQRDDGSVADAGEIGEICAQGDNVMLGYWNDADASAAALRGGCLHTGDLAHRDDDGFIFVQGRRSDMIKIGAHRVHPSEIEEVIAALNDVADVAVVGVDDAILGQVAKAVIVARAGCAPDAMQIKAHCRDHLASYKIPKFIEYTESLPRTASGKLQRFLLTPSPAGGHTL